MTVPRASSLTELSEVSTKTLTVPAAHVFMRPAIVNSISFASRRETGQIIFQHLRFTGSPLSCRFNVIASMTADLTAIGWVTVSMNIHSYLFLLNNHL